MKATPGIPVLIALRGYEVHNELSSEGDDGRSRSDRVIFVVG